MLRVAVVVSVVLMLGIQVAAAPASSARQVVAQATLEPATFADVSGDPNEDAIARVARLRVLQGYPDGSFHPTRTVTEGEFAKVIDRLLVACPTMRKTAMDAAKPNQPVTRLRAVAVLMRNAADQTLIDSMSEPDQFLEGFSDAKEIPAWASKLIAFAVARGYISDSAKFRPADPISRSELAGIMARCVPADSMPKTAVAGVAVSVAPVDVADAAGDRTGLVIDCRGMGIQRCMAPQVVTESGEVVYPDRKNLPSVDYMEETGMASYVCDLSNAKRAGSNPIVVKALSVAGAAKQTAVIADADGKSILAEERGGKFLAKYKVTFLMDPK